MDVPGAGPRGLARAHRPGVTDACRGGSAVTAEQVRDVLRGVLDPELGANVVELGLVYDVQIVGTKVFVTMTLTTPLCPMNEMIPDAVRQAVGALPGVGGVDVELVWTPAWEPQMMSRELKERFGW